MVTTNPNTIVLKGDYIQNEFEAAEAITPGHLVQLLAAGTIQKNDAVSQVPRLVALEKEYEGKEIDVAYAASDTVYVAALAPGTEVYALVPAAAAAIVIGDLLVPTTGGTLIKATAVADLTDSTTGTADGTLADVGGAFSQATLNNNFADIAEKVNALLPGGAQYPFAIALEAVDNSGGGAEARIKVMLL